MTITLKLKRGTFWDETSCNLLDGYQRLQKIAASVVGLQEANLDLEDYDQCESNHKPPYLRTLPFITE
jgi:hypothetical protein